MVSRPIVTHLILVFLVFLIIYILKLTHKKVQVLVGNGSYFFFKYSSFCQLYKYDISISLGFVLRTHGASISVNVYLMCKKKLYLTVWTIAK